MTIFKAKFSTRYSMFFQRVPRFPRYYKWVTTQRSLGTAVLEGAALLAYNKKRTSSPLSRRYEVLVTSFLSRRLVLSLTSDLLTEMASSSSWLEAAGGAIISNQVSAPLGSGLPIVSIIEHPYMMNKASTDVTIRGAFRVYPQIKN